jgi:hypothetical protein
MSKTQLTIMRWTARIIALAVITFGLPFYFGYGNPLPFLRPDYKLWDNAWLTIFPLMFIGLGLGWKYEKIGGYLVTVPLAAGILLGLIMERELITHMLVPLIPGILYLMVGYNKADR